MAVLGAQIVITLVMISIIQKLGPYFSIAQWLLCSTGLTRYLYPTDAELKQLANIPKEKNKSKKGKGSQSNGRNEFHIPRNIDVTLQSIKVSPYDVRQLRYFNEYQWLVDFSLYTFIVYSMTEIYQAWFPLKDEMNLSMLWCGLVVIFTFKALLSLTVQYFKGEESVGERSTCIVMGFAYLVISMVVLIIDENTLELGLENAYNVFNKSSSAFLEKQGLNSSGPASKIVLKFFLAIWCGILGSVITFPGLRIARMHWDLLKYYRENRLTQVLLNLSFALPFLLVILWIKPVARDYLTTKLVFGRDEPLLTNESFDSLRVIVISLTMLLKIILMPWYLQAYLNMAYYRTEEQKKETGRITNIDFQKKIGAVFYYLCVVTLQYIAPVLLCLYFTFMYKTLSEYKWTGIIPFNSTTINATSSSSKRLIDEAFNASEELQFALENLKKIFTTEVFKGIFGFSTWWCCFIYFATTSLGLIYQSYFTII